jgi:hypothetical protein
MKTSGPAISRTVPGKSCCPLLFPVTYTTQLQPLDLSLFGITKRLIARANKLDAVNIQTKHIASTVCAFLAAVVLLNIVKTFALSGICLVADARNSLLHNATRPNKAIPLPSAFPDISDVTDDDLDED